MTGDAYASALDREWGWMRIILIAVLVAVAAVLAGRGIGGL